MPVFEIGDLIMGEVRPALASSLAEADLFEVLSGRVDTPKAVRPGVVATSWGSWRERHR